MARALVVVLALCLAATVPTLAQNSNSRRCMDTNRNCVLWAGRGECYKNAGFMYISCPESCGQCKVRDPRCTDFNDMCTAWAKNGECRNNKPYMKKMCSRACGFCTPASDHSVPHVHSHIVQKYWDEYDKRNTV